MSKSSKTKKKEKLRITLVYYDENGVEKRRALLVPSTWEALLARIGEISNSTVEQLWLYDSAAEIDSIELLAPNDLVTARNPMPQGRSQVTASKSAPMDTDDSADPVLGTNSDEHGAFSESRLQKNPVRNTTPDALFMSPILPSSSLSNRKRKKKRDRGPAEEDTSISSTQDSYMTGSWSTDNTSHYLAALAKESLTMSNVGVQDPYKNAVQPGRLVMVGRFALSTQDAAREWEALLERTSSPSESAIRQFLDAVLPSHRSSVVFDRYALEKCRDVAGCPQIMTHVACGANMIVAVDRNGRCYALGDEQLNHVCIGFKEAVLVRDKAHLLSTLTSRRIWKVSSGLFHSAVISDRQEVVLWGYNIDCSTLGVVSEAKTKQLQGQEPYNATGQLGTKKRFLSAPRVVNGLHGRPLQVSCGAAHTVVLTSTGNVYTWGSNADGQLGRVEHPNQDGIDIGYVEFPITATTPVVRCRSISAGAHFTLVSTEKGELYGWGHNNTLQLGILTDKEVQPTPILVHSLSQVHATNVSCGNTHVICTTTQNKVFSWGTNRFGELGRKGSARPHAIAMLPALAWAEVCTADYSSALLSTCGQVYVWGRLMGEGFLTHQKAPRLLTGLKDEFVRSMSLGGAHMALVLSNDPALLLKMFRQACALEEVDLDLLQEIAQEVPSATLRALQDRALDERSAQFKKVPRVLVDHIDICFYMRDLRSNSKLAPTEVYVRNEGKADVQCTVECLSVDGLSVQFEPAQFVVKRGKSQVLSVMLRHSDARVAQPVRLLCALLMEDNKLRSLMYLFVDVFEHRQDFMGVVRRSSDGVFAHTMDFAGSNITFGEKLFTTSTGSEMFSCTAESAPLMVKVLTVKETEKWPDFGSEVDFLANMGHINVIQYLGHDVFKKRGRLFMEYVPLRLHTVIQEHHAEQESIGSKDLKTIALGVARAAAFLHGCIPPIIHRDIRPENVALQRSKKSNHFEDVKLCGFESSKQLENQRSTHEVFGTAAFTAPEVYSGDYSFPADVWSVSMLIFNVLTLREPYSELKAQSVISKVRDGVLPQLPNAIVQDRTIAAYVALMNSCMKEAPKRPTASKVVSKIAKIK